MDSSLFAAIYVMKCWGVFFCWNSNFFNFSTNDYLLRQPSCKLF